MRGACRTARFLQRLVRSGDARRSPSSHLYGERKLILVNGIFQPGTDPSRSLKLRIFGNTGLQVSALGFGGGNIGFQDIPDQTLDRLFGVAFDLGVNNIDTASRYGDSEEKIGRSLRGKRQRFLLFTKCGRSQPPRRSLMGLRLRAYGKIRRAVGFADEYESWDWHPTVLQWNIDQSLRRLRTDWIDLLQLHSCSEAILRKSGVIETLQRARKAGKVRFIGYSGEGSAALYALRSGQFQALQISVNLADQNVIDTILPMAIQRGVAVIAKRPLASSLWKESTRPDPIRHPRHQVYWERLQKLQYDFLRGDRASEIALRFTLSVPGVHTAIAGTTSVDHLKKNGEFAALGALDKATFDSIRSQWSRIAEPDWDGQV